MPTLASTWTRDVLDVERPLERAAQPQAGRARGDLVAGREHEGELVAAEARERVVVAHGAAEPRADLAQHLVAGVMAERVVELLEAVEVDQQQRERLHARASIAACSRSIR